MANTTDIIISCFHDETSAINEIIKNTGLDFLKISDSSKCGGSKIVAFESFAACYRSIGKEKINHLIKVFKKTNFENPELVILMIDDDATDFSTIVTKA